MVPACLPFFLSTREVFAFLFFHHLVSMASIKERAAALNLAEKLRVRPQGKIKTRFSAMAFLQLMEACSYT